MKIKLNRSTRIRLAIEAFMSTPIVALVVLILVGLLSGAQY